MKVLAIDTSNYVLGIAVIDDEKVIGEYITNLKKNHSVRIMPAIETLLRDCDLTAADIEKVVVAQGPGSYTGVRIGVTIAKTLAWSLQVPLTGVSSLAVSAASAGRYFEGLVSPLTDARRGQVYTGLYRYEKGNLVNVVEDQLLLSADWAERLKQYDQPVLFTGNDVPLHKEVIAKTLGDQARFAGLTDYNPRPSELALLGKDKESTDVHTFVPNYIRLAEAEAKWLESKNKPEAGQ
ncbi:MULTISPECIES: tRNA (adenosine(37)-N6)-threonylcarbamoyltransferase complex dimerization subunit type 1 TsaB [Bacillaceae]|uniref:tRNA (adenosine(37)-N6)-threonylcarbamoyltransferase complex dimerization subunit type 1 TsaB n=1 Tax=Bacillaceae TaxID=186817 RepID=UPI000C78BD8C|nr:MULTISPECIES: tRNA (adenosine(37)-N6)-threonylcarbamoyltransferase complex dimerization subunit type 1 TsaB [Bacillus]MDW2879531.1 tRNA (adenosine(37)-N6)-threonylcarbamoyltransferase complex dimerization subunit type 1 TsaB [Bacillus infantis]PLR70103.1 tRNA (adenosine(37)-N6)-threonylcarbamoyltransferase complex dimerization subunit type 1 TsaB [Bacillus sp. UMB0728]